MVKDGNKYRIFYRGSSIADVPAFPKDGTNQVTCLIESTDGINWTRPVLNKVSCNGSTANNIIRKSDSNLECHNFSVFKDENPNGPPNALATGLTTNWFPVTGATPPHTNTISPADPAVFYRLVYP